MKILITGCAGFIGYHLCKIILNNKGNNVYGIDNLNDYYDVVLKKERLKILKKYSNFNYFKLDISCKELIDKNFKKFKYDVVVNLAAQAGVRYSITNPEKYLESNIIGFFNIIESCKKYKIKKFIYASSSSVYGDNKDFPLNESTKTDSPLSFYAASKKTNEIIAHSYSYTYKLPTIGLRFFTVYGPFGRPDMSLFKFVDNISKNKKIDLYNMGNHVRDFTYVDDVVNALEKLIFEKIKFKKIPYLILNIASNSPHTLNYYIDIIQKILGKKAKTNMKSLQMGDIKKTHGDIANIKKNIKFSVNNKLYDGIAKYINWYKEFYK